MSADNEASFEHNISTEDNDSFSFDGYDEKETIYKLLSKTIDETDEDDESDKEYLPKEDEINRMIKEQEEDENLDSDDDDDDDLPENIVGFGQRLAFFLEFVLGSKNMPYYENIENLVHFYDKSDKNWYYFIHPVVYGCYNQDFNLKSHQILERYLQDDNAFDSNLKNYKCLKKLKNKKELQNEFLDYMDVFMDRLFNILDGDEHICRSYFVNDEEETIHEIALDVIMQLFDVFKEDMLPYCEDLLNKLIENYQKFPRAHLCQNLFEMFRDFGNDLMEWHEAVVQVIDEIVFGKEYEYDEQLIKYCLCFFYICFEQDIQLVFERKHKIIKLLKPSFGSICWYQLVMIEKLLIKCNKETFHSLYSDEISEIIRVGCESENEETREVASDVKLMFERQKVESIKFCLLNGYSKQL